MPEDALPKRRPPVVKSYPLLTGQKAIVTGGSSGIGSAICLALAEAGADVVVNFHSGEESAQEIVERIQKMGRKSFAFGADVSKEADVVEMFAKARKTFGRIDIVVCNSGLQKDAAIDEMSLDDWNAVIGVNLTGQFLCAREAVRAFKAQGIDTEVSCAAGKIVCISSVHQAIPWAGHVNYAASKGGVMLMMQSIAQECAPMGIRVNSVAPGAIRTPINEGEAWGTPALEKKLMKLIPYKRIGEPEDIGRVAVWLASDQADYINGATLYVDGGMMLYPGFAHGG